MSKSIGNVIDPYTEVEKYGADPLRYFLLGALPSDEDGDYTHERFEEFYTAHLVNGVGNLTSRVLTMLEKYSDGKVPKAETAYAYESLQNKVMDSWQYYNASLSFYDFNKAISLVNDLINELDRIITLEKPWQKVKDGVEITVLLYELSEVLRHIALMLLPIIPTSAEKILTQLGASDIRSREWGALPSGTKITKNDEHLFPRLEK